MRKISWCSFVGGSAVVMGLATPATAAITVQFSQVGNDVSLTATGTFDVEGLSTLFDNRVLFEHFSNISPKFAFLDVNNGGIGTLYIGITGPSSFGTGVSVHGSNPTGFGSFQLSYGIYGPALSLPTGGYSALAPLTVSAIFYGQTFASMGLTPGTYVYTAPRDTLTVQVGPAALAGVPEPASWAMLIGGFGLVAGMMRRSRRATIRFT